MHVHLLRALICPEPQCAAGTFHDRVRVQAAQNTGLVVFRGIENGGYGVIGVGQDRLARGTGTYACSWARKAESVCAGVAEDVPALSVSPTNIRDWQLTSRLSLLLSPSVGLGTVENCI